MRRGIGGHQSHNAQTDEWLTPPHITKALGIFNLDPASPTSGPWVETAFRHYTEDDDGLVLPWEGRVWLNCPYSGIREWMAKMAAHNHGTALVFARTETRWWFESIWNQASAVRFLQGRLHFHYPDTTRAKANAGAPHALIAYGDHDAEILKNCKIPGAFIVLQAASSVSELAGSLFSVEEGNPE